MDVAAVAKAASEQAKKNASTEPPREAFTLPVKNWGEDIVISGIGGRYPESEHVDEFWDNLLSGQELVSIDDRRWPVGKCLSPILLEPLFNFFLLIFLLLLILS